MQKNLCFPTHSVYLSERVERLILEVREGLGLRGVDSSEPKALVMYLQLHTHNLYVIIQTN